MVLEHRFFGLSNPYPDLSEKSFKYHTLDQAVAGRSLWVTLGTRSNANVAADLVYFAQNAVLPMTNGDHVKAGTEAPWVLVGGSYSGALTGW